ncbi:MAG: hypothetical protein AAFY59_15545, partial [Pseudomonadota bacterium]
MPVSIWSWGITEDLDALFTALAAASEDGFEAAAQPWIDAAPPDEAPEPEEIIANAEARLESANIPKSIKDTLLGAFRRLRGDMEKDAWEEDENGDWEEEDLGDEEDSFDNPLPSRREIPLATSHMFYDDPYASLDYEEIEAQVQARLTAYRAAASKALGHPGQPFLQFVGVSEAAFDAGEDQGPIEPLLWQGFTWVWPMADTVYFLVFLHVDEEV